MPWRVVDWHVARRPKGALARLLERASPFVTVTKDVGELSPWITWPTLHRGVYNTDHGLLFLNQDRACAAAYPPLWDVAAKAGKSVGVFGSLQSYPPTDGLPFAFFVPDTFAPSPQTIPPRFECFQRFNLERTRADGAIASKVKLDARALRDLVGMARNGLRLATIVQLGAQLVLEKWDPLHRARRPMWQAPVAFDMFRNAYARETPDFATFFTNHVAGIMHRYWKHAFPEDFGYALQGPRDRFHARSLGAAMDIVDAQLDWLMRTMEKRQGILVVASSMGQEAIMREEAEAEVRITDAAAFVRATGFSGPFTQHLAMHPDFNFAFPTEAAARNFSERLHRINELNGGNMIFRLTQAGPTVNCGLSKDDQTWVLSDRLIGLDESGAPHSLNFASAGLSLIKRDTGTGYHCPEGMMLWFDPLVAPARERRRIESIEIAPMILDAIGADRDEPVKIMPFRKPARTPRRLPIPESLRQAAASFISLLGPIFG
ncbi:MAG: hypothetical protein AB7O04_05165 [Hyphomonadaceae bacterium]